MPKPLLRPAAVATALIIVLAAAPCGAQLLFPELLPPDSQTVLTIPRSNEAWRALEAAGLTRSASPANAMQNIKTIDFALLFRDALSSTEIALLAPKSSESIAKPPAGLDKNMLTPPNPARFLWIARAADAKRLRDVIEKIENDIMKTAATERHPVTRAKESIGESALVLLTDGETTIGHLANGTSAIWAFSNDANLLRQTARRLARAAPAASPQDGVPPAPPPTPPTALAPAAGSAWTQLVLKTENLPFDIRIFTAAPRPEVRLLGSGSLLGGLLDFLRPRGGGASAGGVRVRPDKIEIETFSLYLPDEPNDAQNPYRKSPGADQLEAARHATPDALLYGGGQLLDMPRLSRSFDASLEAFAATLPNPSASNLNPATLLAHAQIAQIRERLRDNKFFNEIGPAWFYALNALRFQQPGEFPQIDFLVGFQTRDIPLTRRRMAEFETALIRAAHDWLQRQNPAAEIPAPRFDEINETILAGQTIAIRSFTAPGLPVGIRPAWTIHGDRLLLALSSTALLQAIRRASVAPVEKTSALALALAPGMDRVHSYHTIHARQALAPLRAIFLVAARQYAPAYEPLVAQAATALESVDALTLARQGTPLGVHTAIRIDLAQPKAPILPR